MKHINCPHCQAKTEIQDDADATCVVICSICGSHLPYATGETTKSLKPEGRENIDEYELEEELGHGAFGTVWKARDTLLNNFVAIKSPRYEDFTDSEKDLFLREAKVMAQLDHPNIVRVRRVIDREKLTAIVMDFVRGTSLRDYIANQPFESPRAAVALWEKVCRAVHHAHENGVVHRDLKPSNILMTAFHEPMVTDFGLAKADSAEFTVGGDHAVLGNAAHMAPEQAAGRSSDADRRSDVYSLGSILYELLTERTPFEGSKRSISDLKQNFDPAPPSRFNKEVPRDLDTITAHAMERNPDHRYQTAAELADDLRRYLDGRPIVARPVPLFERGWRWAKRNRPLAAAFSAIGLMGISLVAMLTFSGSGGQISDGRHPVRIAVTMRGAETDGTLKPRRNRFNEPITLPLAKGNARVKFWLRDPTTGVPQREHSPPEVRTDSNGYANVRLLPGYYLVVAEVEGHGFHEVDRTIPREEKVYPEPSYRHTRWQKGTDGVIELLDIDVPPLSVVTSNMAAYETVSNQSIGLHASMEFPLHVRRVEGFFIDRDEATVELWNRFESAAKSAAAPNFPLTGLSYDDAISLAEWVGKRLPSEFEYETAATNEGTTKFPWGELDRAPDIAWPLGAVGVAPYDVNLKGVRGLFSNVAEMMETWANVYPPQAQLLGDCLFMPRDTYVVRGFPGHLTRSPPPRAGWEPGPADRSMVSKTDRKDRLGVRFARSKVPRFTLVDETAK